MRKIIVDCVAPVKCRLIVTALVDEDGHYLRLKYVTLGACFYYEYAFVYKNPEYSYRPDIIGD